MVDKLVRFLKKKPLSIPNFEKLTDNIYPNLGWEERFELLKLQGLPLIKRKNKIYLKTAFTPFWEGEYCIVDIEVTHSKPSEGQIIEIGAVVIRNGKMAEEFSSLIYAPSVPEYITKITGIDEKMLAGEKSQKKVLEEFRLFLGDKVFASHPASFDYQFLAQQFQRENLGELLNRPLCTLKLANKTINAPRYGLQYLKEELHLPQEPVHRALGDARTTARVFLESWKHLPPYIRSVEELIEFANGGEK
ncbi:MAG: DNA polymerase III subunit epsilon [Epsilonproteobacteria bacterium]|nr:DNA polymerase III subunit epsilon [Campylobacterota bacterium]NPA89150.1 3'-5' exonuclease [Campylobacterota bacterium]